MLTAALSTKHDPPSNPHYAFIQWERHTLLHAAMIPPAAPSYLNPRTSKNDFPTDLPHNNQETPGFQPYEQTCFNQMLEKRFFSRRTASHKSAGAINSSLTKKFLDQTPSSPRYSLTKQLRNTASPKDTQKLPQSHLDNMDASTTPRSCRISSHLQIRVSNRSTSGFLQDIINNGKKSSTDDEQPSQAEDS